MTQFTNYISNSNHRYPIKNRMYERLSLFVNYVNRRVTVAVAIVITTLLIVDLLATRQILFFDNSWQTIIFVLTVVFAYGIGALILLVYARRIRSAELVEKRSHFVNIMYFGVVVVHFSLLAILISILVGNSISCPNHFSFCMATRPLATSINAIASTGAGIILGIISFKFFSWFKSSNRNVMILLYGLAAASLAMSITIDAADKILLQQVIVENSPRGAVPESSWIYKSFDKYQGQVQYKVVNPETTTQYVVPDSMKALHKFLVYLVSNPPYILTWIATLMLLRQFYLSNYGRGSKFPVKYWILLSVPLVLYVIGSGLIVSLPPAEDPYRYLFRIIFRGGTIGCSVLFGISFFIITRKVTEAGIRNRNILSVERIKDYLTISAIGIVMIGIANEASALQQTFGIAAHGFVLLSSFLFSVGLYYSAISISQDSSLRRLIRKSTVQLLDNIGTAQMTEDLLARIKKLVLRNQQMLEDEAGISSELNEINLKEDMELVMEELRKNR
jgi:hypothetical protein